jgi:hypothetical protein
LKDPAPVLEMDRAQLIDQGESPRDFNIQDFSPPKLCDFLKQHAYVSEPRIVPFFTARRILQLFTNQTLDTTILERFEKER